MPPAGNVIGRAGAWLSLFALRQLLLLLLLSASDLSAHLKEEGEGVAQQQEEMRMRRGIRFSQFLCF